MKCFKSSLLLVSVVLLGCNSTWTKTIKGTRAMKGSYRSHSNMGGSDIFARCQNYLDEAGALKKQLIEQAPRVSFLNTLNTYNEILIRLDAAMSQASLFSQVHPNEKVRKEAESCEQKASSFSTDLFLDHEVFAALQQGENAKLDQEASRLVEHTLRDFRRSGVDKSEEERQHIKKIQEELVDIGQQFGQNIRDDRLVIKLDSVDDLKGMPADFIKSHQAGADGKIEISTDYPDYIPFMKYADSDKYKKELRFQYLNRAAANSPVLKQMIAKRYELAQLLGYKSYADYIVEDKMIKNAQSIHEFIKKISDIAKEGADKEYAALLQFKRQKDSQASAIEGYESSYLEELYKKKHFGIDSQQVRSYFAYNKVLDGLLAVTGKLFGIHYEPVSNAEVWHPSVVSYDVFDNQKKLGRIYLDMHPREGKYKHAAQFTVLSGLKDRQYPEGALVCNLPEPTENDANALMEHREVVTMFHEFGHLLHHIFAGQQQWMAFSGVATEWDFVEAPSQLLEEWAWSAEVLNTFATNEKNEAIPVELVSKMRAAEEFGKAISVRQQMFYAALSADYFDKDPKSFEPLELLQKLQAQYSYFPYQSKTHFENSFGHLEGYSAMYYTYMWSLSIAKDLLEPFKNNGLMDLTTAARYRDLVLKPGGSKDAKDLVEDFLGRSFSFDAFEKWLKA